MFPVQRIEKRRKLNSATTTEQDGNAPSTRRVMFVHTQGGETLSCSVLGVPIKVIVPDGLLCTCRRNMGQNKRLSVLDET